MGVVMGRDNSDSDVPPVTDRAGAGAGPVGGAAGAALRQRPPLCVRKRHWMSILYTHSSRPTFDGGFVVHFFDRALVDRLATGFELVDIAGFTEGQLPRRLWRVTMRVPGT
jgi:hypothetical protein